MTQGWEIAVAGIGAALIVIVLAALAGIAVAAELFGHGWVWPHGTDAITHTVGGILTGNPAHGLPAADAHRLASTPVTYVCIAQCEVLAIAAAVLFGVTIARHLRDDGMATARDAERVLGIGELRVARAIIRPDLYGSGPRGTSVDGADTRGRLPGRRRWRRGSKEA